VTHGQCDARPTVAFPASEHYQIILLADRHMCVNVCEQLSQGCYVNARKQLMLFLCIAVLTFFCSQVSQSLSIAHTATVKSVDIGLYGYTVHKHM